jgi:hypothetical protein
MQQVLIAILPVSLLIIFGHLLKKKHFTNQHFWDDIDRIVYYVFLPALFFRNIAHTNFNLDSIIVAVIFIINIMITMVLTILVQKFYATDAPSFTSILQGSIRFNNYIGLSTALVLFGAQSIGYIVSISALAIPVVNLLCTYLFCRYLPDKNLNIWQIVKKIFSNPFVSSCVAAIVFSCLKIPLPSVIDNALKMIGDTSLALGLLGVGAGLKFRVDKKYYLAITISSFLKLLIMPTISIILAIIANVSDRNALLSLILISALPNATSSYVASKQIGGNSNLMSQIIFIQIIISIFTLPLILGWFN